MSQWPMKPFAPVMRILSEAEIAGIVEVEMKSAEEGCSTSVFLDKFPSSAGRGRGNQRGRGLARGAFLTSGPGE